MSDGPYTTITVAEYTHLSEVIGTLRRRIQEARQQLETGAADLALRILKTEDDRPELKIQ